MFALQLILPVVLVTFHSKPTTGNANFSVMEKGALGIVVYNVTQACPELPTVQNVLDNTGTLLTFNTYFNVSSDKLVARVRTTVQLDRDEIASLMGNTVLPVWYTVSIFILNPRSSCLIRLRVTDINDHIPTFPRSVVNMSIPEGPLSGPVSWSMDLARDVDEGTNSTQNYYINTTDPIVSATFQLNMTRDSYGTIVLLHLVRITPISRRQTPSFSFVLVAEEGTPSAPKGYQNVFINVEHVCSTPPIFQLPVYIVQVPEDTSVNSVVLRVKAIGQDVDTKLNYSIASQCAFSAGGGACASGTLYPANGSTPFALGQVSGNLTLIQKLDYETVHQINLLVVATDSCNFVGSAQVQVMVVYVNNNPPVIQFIPPMSTIAINEDITLSSDVATVTITSPVNFNSAVVDNATGLVSGTFYLHSLGSSYRLRLLHLLDSKVQSSYNVTIKATDARNNVAYSTVSITVLAVNHPPIFDNKTAYVSIFDNTANGTVILRVHASDSDLGGYGNVTYEVPPSNATFPYQNNFTANSVSGDVLINGMLDRKVASSFLLLIKGRDNPTNGEPYLSDYMTVNVTLIGASINRPMFPPQPSQVNVSENILVGSVIFRVVANSNGTLVTYGLAAGSVFQIDSVSGGVSVVGNLNNSATKQYILNITAYNGFPPPSTYILTINVLPGDTVGPVFIPRLYSALVMRTAAVGSHVVNVNAMDMYSTALRYEIVDGNGDGKFAVNPANGTISVLKRLDQSTTQTYILHVKASDPMFYSKWLAEVVISLQDLIFANTPYYFQVQEGVPGGTVVGSISVLLSSSGQVRFYIVNGSDALSIDPTSGMITTARPLAASNGSAYTVRIQAVYTPSAGQGLMGTTVLQDVNIFVIRRQSVYNVTVQRSLEVGTTVLNVSTADPSPVGVATYSLISLNPVPFQVDASTGSIYTTKYLDSMPNYTYTFGIVVAFSDPSLGPTVQLFITVTIQVDLSILFDAATYNFTVLRTQTKGTVIGTIRATGRRNADIYYAFNKDDLKTYFQITNTTGQISLLVDATQLPEGTLVADVLAHDLLRDSLTPTLWSVAPVSITLAEPYPRSSPPETINIVIIVVIIAGVLIVLFIVLIVALVTLRKKKHYNPKVSDGDGSHAPNNGCEMQTFGGRGGNNPASLTSIKPMESYPEPTAARRETVEVDSPESESPPKDAPIYGMDSLSRPPKHIRSTSDLASTVGTEMLSGLEDAGPYTKAQLMAIYAANAQLLQDDISQDSVHMFGSEGGVEADDQEVDIDRMLFAKAIGFEEDDHGCTSEATVGRDIVKDEQSMCSAGGSDSHTARDSREQPRYRFAEKDSWLPVVTSVTDTIDELVGEDPRFSNDRLSYPLSQAMSLYSEGGSQSLLMRSQPAPHHYYRGGEYIPRSLHESGYFNETDQHSHQARMSKHRLPPDHRYEAYPQANSGAYPPRVHRYSSTTAIPHPHPHPNAPHSTGPQRKHQQDPQQSNLRPPHTPSSNTPTDDGLMETIPTQRVPAYYSSISSLASTNLSQPGPRDRTLY